MDLNDCHHARAGWPCVCLEVNALYPLTQPRLRSTSVASPDVLDGLNAVLFVLRERPLPDYRFLQLWSSRSTVRAMPQVQG